VTEGSSGTGTTEGSSSTGTKVDVMDYLTKACPEYKADIELLYDSGILSGLKMLIGTVTTMERMLLGTGIRDIDCDFSAEEIEIVDQITDISNAIEQTRLKRGTDNTASSDKLAAKTVQQAIAISNIEDSLAFKIITCMLALIYKLNSRNS
jgi:hypothetical protein